MVVPILSVNFFHAKELELNLGGVDVVAERCSDSALRPARCPSTNVNIRSSQVMPLEVWFSQCESDLFVPSSSS